MFVIRGIFWIVLMLLLVPHDPDLDFGNPRAACTTNLKTCLHSAHDVSTARAMLFTRIMQVKVDLQKNR